MNSRTIHRGVATLVFAVSALQFLLTAQVSVPFWDPGELSAAANLLQVPHPPGGPLFLLVGRIFYMLPIPGNPGFRMNAVSALASAFSVLFLYLIIVKLIRNYKGRSPQDTFDAFATSISAAIGAFALSFSTTFWFSGVESNYFAFSTFLFSAITWFLLVWDENSDQPHSSKYLLIMAYLVGLSAGVHLMSVLAIVTVAMVVSFKNYVVDEEACKKTGYILLVHVALLLIVTAVMWKGETSSVPPAPEEYHSYDVKFIMTMIVISALVMGLFWKKVFQRNSIYIPLIIGGIALAVAYPGIIKLLPKLLLRIAGDNTLGGLFVLLIVFGLLGYLAYWAAKNKKNMVHLVLLSIMAAMFGFTTYTMIVIRAGVHPPMNENEPKTLSTLVPYLDREQYGDFPIFKRRWTPEPDRQMTYTNYSSDLDFFWRYQMDHMFNRYVFWSFIGRESSDQDAGVDWKQLFGIPFFVGLFGLYFHFRKDWKMASAFFVLFIFMGYLIAFYQNQQQPQPRDRDYFYPGAYLVFAAWIGLGIRGLVDLVREKFPAPRTAGPIVAGVLILGLGFIPGRMFQTNYRDNDRSKNWVAWDYSYNMLQTCEPDAILFTNGDNDTFPLWYLQDVEGVRRDVRIVNLSLVNTPWYIQQMKDKPYYAEAKPVPVSYSDQQIARIQPVVWEPKDVDLPVPPEVFKRYGVSDTALTNRRSIRFHMKNTAQYGDTKVIRVQDLMVRDIIFTNQWKRPVYFAVTVSPDSKIGLDEYFSFCGLAMRLVPKKSLDMDGSIDVKVLQENLLNEPHGYSVTPQYGYKFRNVADPDVYFDENTSRLMINYRSAFIRLALYYANVSKDNAKGAATLDRMEQLMPRSKVAMGWELTSDIAFFYQRLGRLEKFNELAAELEPTCKRLIESGQANMNSYYNPYRVLLELYDGRKEYAKSLEILRSLATLYPNDPGIKTRMAEVQAKLNLPPAVQPPSEKK